MAGTKGKKEENEQLRPIIIKRIKKGGGGHHGGAWKVAYADFVTAMMAFFLLLWLLNVTTEEQKNAISNYFDPSHPKVSDVVSGAGGVLGGMTMTVDGAMVSTVQPIVQAQMPDTTTRGALQGQTEGQDTDVENLRDAQTEDLLHELRKREDERFKKAAEDLKKQVESTPDLKALEKNLLIDITPEGLRIQIVDDKGRSMFPIGSAKMHDFMRLLLLKVAGVITPLPNQVSVRGHTDSFSYKDPTQYDNWNLSADRAQASRRVLVEGGVPEKRIENVMGRADREHLDTANPQSEKNRRISIILLREKLDPKTLKEKLAAEAAKTKAAKTGGKPAAGTTANAPAGSGLQIIDDTKTPAPAPRTDAGETPPQPPAQTQPQASQPEGTMQPQPQTPLPVTGGDTVTVFKRLPQVMYFGEKGGETSQEQQSAPLYDGPAHDPIVSAPKAPAPAPAHTTDAPATHTPPATTQAPAHATPATPAPQPAPEPEPAHDPKTMTFGEVPQLTTPTKPEAPALTPAPEAPKTEPSKKVLEF